MNNDEQAKPIYVVSYTYDNPSGAGPYKGRIKTTEKCKKGESIIAAFGQATVTSCRLIKAKH